MSANPSLRFLSWFRQGLTAGKLAANSGTSGRLQLAVRLRVNQGSAVELPVESYGPGDIVGIDAREVIRTEPVHLTQDFEPNRFPLIEFDRPDFPWIFTPEPPDSQRRLRPWLCMVAIRKDRAKLSFSPAQPLPVLQCPLDELPPLEDAWAWAHAQLVNDQPLEPDLIRQIVRNQPDRTLSRLICPRRLDPGTSYLACVVPTYDLGRRAGLGLAITDGDARTLSPAWPWPEREPGLPVYYHWEFGTGSLGDFEAAARRIVALPSLPEGIGARELDVGAAGWGMPEFPHEQPGVVAPLEGALRPAFRNAPPWDDAMRQAYAVALGRVIDAPRTLDEPLPEPALIRPPVYGQSGARSGGVADPAAPAWFRELNLDPRHRIAAGLGTRVVRFEQEGLMASAWDQLAAAAKENAERNRLQVADQLGQLLIAKHLANLSEDRLSALVGSVTAPDSTQRSASRAAGERAAVPRSRVAVGEAISAAAASSAALRRLTRFRGPIARRSAAQSRRGVSGVKALTASTATSETLARLVNARVARGLSEGARAKGLGKQTVRAMSLDRRELAPDPGAIYQTLTFAPTFPQPMYAPLRDYFPEFLLPGVGQIPPNSVCLLETNPQFIEAFLVGLNHEMERELLWRGYPVRAGRTYFQRFWEAGTESSGIDAGSIPPLGDWAPSSALGEHLSNSSGLLVLLIRGDLLRRYPTATVYTTEAVWMGSERDLGQAARYPVFRAMYPPDTTLLGFPLTEQEARGAESSAEGAAGWFFVIQQHPTEAGFGLDVPRAAEWGTKPTQWRDLSWAHLAGDADELAGLSHVPLGGRLAGHACEGIPWGQNSAHMARITRQPPFRLALHARQWLPQRTEGTPP